MRIEHLCRAFPANTLIRSSGSIRSRSARGTFAVRKRPSFLASDGLLKKTRHMLSDLFGIKGTKNGGRSPRFDLLFYKLFLFGFLYFGWLGFNGIFPVNSVMHHFTITCQSNL